MNLFSKHILFFSILITINISLFAQQRSNNNPNISEINKESFALLNGDTCPGMPTVEYGGQTYNTVLIGNQCWMKENLNIGTRIDFSQDQTNNSIIEKYCYYDDELNCKKYGGLYQWSEMMQYTTIAGTQGICPDGWHLPTIDELNYARSSNEDIFKILVDPFKTIEDPFWVTSQAGTISLPGFAYWASTCRWFLPDIISSPEVHIIFNLYMDYYYEVAMKNYGSKYITKDSLILKLPEYALSVRCTKYARKVISNTSKSGNISIKIDPLKPPYLEIIDGSLQFLDEDGNNKIDANENTMIRFELHNSGLGPGLDLKVIIKESINVNGLNYEKAYSIGMLDVGKTIHVEIPIVGQMNLPDHIADFEIRVDEANGFDSDPINIKIETQAFRAPLVKVVDYKVSSQRGNTLKKRRPFDLQVLVQNLGQGVAKNVKVQLTVPENVYCLSANEIFVIGTLEPGESRLIEYNLVTNNEYLSETIPFTVVLNELHGQYSEDKCITLQMNQSVSDTKLIVQGKDEEVTKIVFASLSSDVDRNIPLNDLKYSNKFALVIGNEEYTKFQRSIDNEINVVYAKNDASVFSEYLIKTLGFKKENVYLLLDATKGEMERKIDLISKRCNLMSPESELIFYYAGHGLPDEETKEPYLIPVDVSGSSLRSGIKLSDVYDKLDETRAKRITVFLDACFSGGARNQGLVAARGVKVKPKQQMLKGNVIVFSASSGDQSSLPYKEKQHGMFTYYLLKGIQQNKGIISYKDLFDYVKQEVSNESLRVNEKEQYPNIRTSPAIEEDWHNWMLYQ